MSLSNREIQQRKNCQLYRYVLQIQNKEIPFHIEECADYNEYNCLLDCSKELIQEIKNFDDATHERIINNQESEDAKDLSQWWEMYKLYIPINDSSVKK